MFAPERKEDPTTSTRKHLVLQELEEVDALGCEVVTTTRSGRKQIQRRLDMNLWI